MTLPVKIMVKCTEDFVWGGLVLIPFIVTIIIITLVVWVLYMMGYSTFLMFKKPIECPACGRKIKIGGKSARCYKCKSSLFKHQNGEYMVKN